MNVRSIRWQIQLGYAALLAVVTAVLLTAFYYYEKEARHLQLDHELASAVMAMFPLHFPPDGRGFRLTVPGIDREFEKRFEEGGYYIVAYDRNGKNTYRSPHAPAAAERPPAEVARMPTGRWHVGLREMMQISPLGESLILGAPANLYDAELRRLALQLWLAGAAIVAFGLLVGAWIASKALLPIREISDAAREIAGGNWARRINAPDAPAELSDLRDVLNASFERIATAYQQQARFTADASHELGTPVSVVVSQSGMALSRERTLPECVDALHACQRAGRRMKLLLHGLLELAEYDAGAASLEFSRCDLNAIIEDALDLIEPLKTEHQAMIQVESQPTTLQASPVALSQALANLLKNAIIHNEPGVRIALRVTIPHPARAVIEIADNGRGIPEEALPFLFDRFYRVDKSRTRADGGSGLGLSIVKSIAEVHAGAVSVSNAPGGGAVFRIALPAIA